MSASFLLRLRADSNGIVDLAGNTFTNYNVTYTNEGKFTGGKALTFAANGSKSMLLSTAAIGDAFGTGDFTISYWLKMRGYSGTSSPAPHIGQHTNSDDVGEFMTWGADYSSYHFWSGLKMVYADAQSELVTAMPSTEQLPMANWHHIAYTRNNGTVRAFCDGALANSLSFSSSVGVASKAVTIGCIERYWDTADDSKNFYIGDLDDICLIKGAALWTANFTPPTYYLALQKYLFIDENRAVWGQT